MLITDIICRQGKLLGELEICSKIVSGLDEAILKPLLIRPPVRFCRDMEPYRSLLDYIIYLEPVPDSCTAILMLRDILAHLDTVSQRKTEISRRPMESQVRYVPDIERIPVV